MTTAAETFVKPKNTKIINTSGNNSGSLSGKRSSVSVLAGSVLSQSKGSMRWGTKAAVVREDGPSPVAVPVMPAFLAATKTEDVLPKGSVTRVVRQTNTKAKARAYLRELGLIDKNGKPAAQYR
jgi:hypothetical protein